MSAVADLDLSSEQAAKILEVALAASFYERYDGALPRDEKQRQEDAREMVRQCRLSFLAGNRKQPLVDILYLAGVEPGENSSEGERTTVSDQEDLSQHSSEMLGKILEALETHRANAATEQAREEIDGNIDIVRDEVLKRANGGDAVAEKVAQTFTSLDQTQSQPQQAAPQVDRKALEDRLSFPIMRAHGIDPSQIDDLSDDELQWIIDHPDGGEQPEPTPVAASTPEPTGETFETTRMVVKEPEPEAPSAPKEAKADGPSDERLRMEEQVTGLMLKAFGRGRNEVPSEAGIIGDHELRFMLDHPDGQVTLEELQAAQALDKQDQDEPEPEPVLTIAQQIAAQKAKEEGGDGFTPEPAAEPEKPKRRGRPPKAKEEEQPQEPAENPAAEIPPSSPPKQTSITHDLPVNPAQERIDRENFPIPPEIDGDPPRLPFDLSKESDASIMSYHSRFHACAARANYIVGLWESELRDIQRLRKGREVEVANSLPIRDGRAKLTESQREIMVQADEEVMRLKEEEHQVERVLRQLRVLSDSYSTSVAVCSRQMSMRHREADGAR